MIKLNILCTLISFSAYTLSLEKSHWIDRKNEAWDRYLIFQDSSGGWYEKDVLWNMQSKESYKECETKVTSKYSTYYDVYFKVDTTGKAIEIEWYPDINDGGCISNFLRSYQFPKPPITMPLWLQMYPGEI